MCPQALRIQKFSVLQRIPINFQCGDNKIKDFMAVSIPNRLNIKLKVNSIYLITTKGHLPSAIKNCVNFIECHKLLH